MYPLSNLIVIKKYSRLTRMLEEDNEGFGLYAFNSQSSDPQTTNAINTEIISTIKSLVLPAKSRDDEYSGRVR